MQYISFIDLKVILNSVLKLLYDTSTKNTFYCVFVI